MIKNIVLKLIRVYQKTLSFDHGLFSFVRGHRGCRFYPSCSQYGYEAIEKYGLLKGALLALKRLSRCHPFSAGGLDPLK